MSADLKVVPLNPPDRRGGTVSNALERAAARGLTDVLVIGYDEDGDLVYVSSAMTSAEALWMVERARKRILD
jgi:hypothetical protein